MSTIVIAPKEHCITTNKIVYNLRDIIPAHHNIRAIRTTFDENIKSIKIRIGDISIDFVDAEKLAALPVYLTLCKYVNVEIIIIYDTDYIAGLMEYEMVDETIEETEYSDDIVTIFDGFDYHTGNIVTTKEVPTGNKIKRATRGAIITSPELSFDLFDVATPAPTEPYIHKFRQRIKISGGGDDADYIKLLEEKYGLIRCDDDLSFGYIDNELIYHSGLAGLRYYF